jgi:hypothetical protein
MALDDVVLTELPNTGAWFTVATGATLSLEGHLNIMGNSNIAVYCNAAGSTLHASDVIFYGFTTAAPLAIHGGSAYLNRCTFEQNTASALSIYAGGGCFILHMHQWVLVMLRTLHRLWILVCLLHAGYVLVKEGLFSNNDVSEAAIYNKGAAVDMEWGTLVVIDSNFVSNHADAGETTRRMARARRRRDQMKPPVVLLVHLLTC